jgi:uncharacterized protein YbjT (DUF2867 family)
MQKLVTVFGGSGFLGRYVVQELAKADRRVRVAVREPTVAPFLRTQGGLGQIHLTSCDIRRAGEVEAALQGSSAAINLVGILSPSKGASFEAVHVAGAGNIARAARAFGLEALVHVSAIGADAEAEAAYARSKGEGEEEVRRVFPNATILRPSVIFGPEDDFINRFAALARGLPLVPVLAGGTRFQPVYVLDVARAIVRSVVEAEPHAGRTYELGGPRVYTMRELIGWIRDQIMVRKSVVEVPAAAARFIARFGGLLPGAPLTYDQWLMLQRDNVVGEGAAGIEELGVRPTPLEAVAPLYLVRFRKQGRFNTGESGGEAAAD